MLSVRDCPDPREICSIVPAAITGMVVMIKNMSNMTPVAKVFFTFLPPYWILVPRMITIPEVLPWEDLPDGAPDGSGPDCGA